MRAASLRFAICLLIAPVGYVATSADNANARTAVQRDVEGYAIASCLGAQHDPYLSDQADGWGSAIIQRGKGGLEPLRAIQAAVNKEVAKGNMAVILSETSPTKDKALPMMYCYEIIDAPSVHAAIQKAEKQLAPSYHGR